MFNDGQVGPANHIQLPLERIKTLRGVMVDLDPGKLRLDNGIFEPAAQPAKFLELISAVIDRHPLARHAEVRATGTGLHLLLWFEPRVEMHTGADQRRWRGIVRAIHASLPSDGQARLSIDWLKAKFVVERQESRCRQKLVHVDLTAVRVGITAKWTLRPRVFFETRLRPKQSRNGSLVQDAASSPIPFLSLFLRGVCS